MKLNQNSNQSNLEKEASLLTKKASSCSQSLLNLQASFDQAHLGKTRKYNWKFLIDYRISSIDELEFFDKAISKLSFKCEEFELMLLLRLKVRRYIQSNDKTKFSQDYFWRYYHKDSGRYSHFIPLYFNSLPPNSTLEKELFKYELMNPLLLIKAVDIDAFRVNASILDWIEFHLREWLDQLAIINKAIDESMSSNDFQTYRRKMVP